MESDRSSSRPLESAPSSVEGAAWRSSVFDASTPVSIRTGSAMAGSGFGAADGPESVGAGFASGAGGSHTPAGVSGSDLAGMSAAGVLGASSAESTGPTTGGSATGPATGPAGPGVLANREMKSSYVPMSESVIPFGVYVSTIT